MEGRTPARFAFSPISLAERVTAIIGPAGATLLRNGAVQTSGLQFVGLDDFWSPRYDPAPIISRGVGHLLRVRFNVRPEVTLFRLRVA